MNVKHQINFTAVSNGLVRTCTQYQHLCILRFSVHPHLSPITYTRFKQHAHIHSLSGLVYCRTAIPRLIFNRGLLTWTLLLPSVSSLLFHSLIALSIHLICKDHSVTVITQSGLPLSAQLLYQLIKSLVCLKLTYSPVCFS